MPPSTTRRALLAAGTGVAAALAGCADRIPATDEDAATTTTDDLDLREANVVDVAFERVDDAYRFDVTLLHDDDGEDGYADWWQVETPDGDRLGRRDLLHAHGTETFTRSETVEVPDDAACVVVRGHDETHDYGGQATVANLDAGGVRAVRQGPEPRSFADVDCAAVTAAPDRG